MINQTLLSELHIIVLEEYGLDLSSNEVLNLANALLGYYDGLVEAARSGGIEF